MKTALESDPRVLGASVVGRDDDRLGAVPVAAVELRAGAGTVAPDDLMEDPQLKHREHFWWIQHSELGNYPHIGESFQLSETPVKPRLPAPSLGEHTEYVCNEIIKMPDDEFLALLEEGVFE